MDSHAPTPGSPPRPAGLALRVLAPIVIGLLIGTAPLAEASPWEEAEWLAEHLEVACTLVEGACEATYPERPSVRISTPDEVLEILRGEMAPMQEGLGDLEKDAVDGFLQQMKYMLLAKYEPETNVVHVLPANAARLALLLDIPDLESKGLVRVILVHEAVHALDFLRFPNLAEGLKTRSENDARQALSAVIEGHAQLRSEQIAKDIGLEASFATYVRSITAEPPGLDGVAALVTRLVAAEAGFAYGQGHRFVAAVYAARGREGIEAILASPPLGTRVIERPELYLDPEAAAGEVDLDAALAQTAEAVEALGAETLSQRLLAAALAVQFEILPEEERGVALALYDDGRVLVGQHAEDGWAVNIALLRMRDIPATDAWMVVEERLGRLKDEKFKEGAVRITESVYETSKDERGRPFLVMTKTVQLPFATQKVISRIRTASHFAIEAVYIDAPPEIVTKVEAAVEALAISLLAPKTAAPKREPEPAGAR